nr:MAG: Mitochondrial ribosomal protein subunit L20 [Bacteriophage sp.]
MREGKDGYIVERKGKKLSDEQVEQIKNDTGSYKAKAEKYKVSVGTISKIMNDQY